MLDALDARDVQRVAADKRLGGSRPERIQADHTIVFGWWRGDLDFVGRKTGLDGDAKALVAALFPVLRLARRAAVPDELAPRTRPQRVGRVVARQRAVGALAARGVRWDRLLLCR